MPVGLSDQFKETVRETESLLMTFTSMGNIPLDDYLQFFCLSAVFLLRN